MTAWNAEGRGWRWQDDRVLVTIAAYALYALLNVGAVLLLRANLPTAVHSFRAGDVVSASGGRVALGAVMYAVSFLCWLVILSRSEVSRAYPTAVGITMVLTTVGAIVFLTEKVTLWQLSGTVLVFGGVVLLTRT